MDHEQFLANIRKYIIYNPNTGLLNWRVNKGIAKAGDPIGTLHRTGYLVFKFEGKQYLVHRIIWLYVTGDWPLQDIDHKNTNKTNNKWNNFRLATDNENQRNKNLQSNNTSGYKGVYWHKPKQKWRAHIKVNGKTLTLGQFDNILDAVKAREEAGKLYHKEFNKT